MNPWIVLYFGRVYASEPVLVGQCAARMEELQRQAAVDERARADLAGCLLDDDPAAALRALDPLPSGRDVRPIALATRAGALARTGDLAGGLAAAQAAVAESEGASKEARGIAYEALGRIAAHTGDAAARDHLGRAIRLLGAGGRPDRVAIVSDALAALCHEAGDHAAERAAREQEYAAAVAAWPTTSADRVLATVHLISVMQEAGDIAGSEPLLAGLGEALEQVDGRAGAVLRSDVAGLFADSAGLLPRAEALYVASAAWFDTNAPQDRTRWIVWSNLAGLYGTTGRYAEALAAADRAAPGAEQIGAEYFVNRSTALEGLGRVDEALAALDRARAEHEAAGDLVNALDLRRRRVDLLDAERGLGELAAIAEQARRLSDPRAAQLRADALADLGNALIRADRYEDAVVALTQAIDVASELFGAHHRRVATVRAARAFALLRAGDVAQARTEIEAALVDLRAGGDRSDLRVAMQHQGAIRQELGDWEGTVAAYREAVDAWDSLVHPHAQVAWFNLGQAYIRADRYDEAAEALAEARRQAEELGRPSFHVDRELAVLYRKQGRTEDALAAGRRAVDGLADLYPPTAPEIVVARTALANALHQAGRTAEAIAEVDAVAALDLAPHDRMGAIGLRAQYAWFLGDESGAQRDAAEVFAHALATTGPALPVLAPQARAKALLDLLYLRDLLITVALARGDVAAARDAAAALRGVGLRLDRRVLDEARAARDPVVAALIDARDEAAREGGPTLDAAEEALRAALDLGAPPRAPKPGRCGGPSVLEVVQYNRFVRTEQAIVRRPSYVVFAVDPESCAAIAVDLGKVAPIDEAIHRVTTLIAGHALATRVERQIEELSELVWWPIADAVALRPDLVIIPDGAFATAPWAALLGRDGARVVEQHTVSLATGAGPAPRGRTRGALVVGDVAFGAPAVASWGPLPGSGLEATAVAALLARRVGARHVVTLTGAAATPEAVAAAAADVRVLHVSTHGSWLPAADGATALDRAALVLAGANEHERGVWTGRQVVASGASARTVVLSACESGAASAIPGDGVYGMVRAFQLGGAREVVATNWPVQDAEAVRFTEDLHRALARTDAARALRDAQLAASRRGWSPTAWAAWAVWSE
jgi:CHAT domain-containing protein/tetratricopeptide (TPR) repeat protein